VPTADNNVYLTFDDGPEVDITDNVIEILNKYNVKATFFCVGENVHKHPDIFSKIINENHAVGNHTYNHLNGWKTKKDIYLENVYKCHKLINTSLFRPPYGRITYPQAFAIKTEFKIVMWSVLTYDFKQNINPEKCLKNSIKNTKKGSIVVFHDNIKAEKTLSYTLPRYIEAMLEKDFVFKTL